MRSEKSAGTGCGKGGGHVQGIYSFSLIGTFTEKLCMNKGVHSATRKEACSGKVFNSCLDGTPTLSPWPCHSTTFLPPCWQVRRLPWLSSGPSSSVLICRAAPLLDFGAKRY